MSRKSAKRVATVLIASLALLNVPAEAYAQSLAANRASRGASPASRIVWSLIGAGLGFGAGLMFGLHKFDDAINSDRKVWTSALIGAAIGGVAGGTLSGDVKPPFVPKHQPKFDPAVTMPRVSAGVSEDMALRSRVAAANQRQFSVGGGATAQAVKRKDPLWEGMAIGAAAGAVVGLVVVPNNECKPENPECPRLLRIGVGIPAIAAGAALGAPFDRIR